MNVNFISVDKFLLFLFKSRKKFQNLRPAFFGHIQKVFIGEMKQDLSDELTLSVMIVNRKSENTKEHKSYLFLIFSSTFLIEDDFPLFSIVIQSGEEEFGSYERENKSRKLEVKRIGKIRKGTYKVIFHSIGDLNNGTTERINVVSPYVYPHGD